MSRLGLIHSPLLTRTHGQRPKVCHWHVPRAEFVPGRKLSSHFSLADSAAPRSMVLFASIVGAEGEILTERPRDKDSLM